MKNKVFYPYILIEFALFIACFFFAVNPLFTFNFRILIVIGLGINIVFSLLLTPKEKIDRWFNLVSSIFFFTGELTLYITSSLTLYLLFILLGFATITARLFLIEKDSPKIKIVTVITFLLCHIILLFLLAFRLFDLSIFFLLDIVMVSITNILLMIHRYRNGNILHKPNWFFGGSGTIIFVLYILCYVFGPKMDDTAMLKGVVSFGSSVLIIPAVLMLVISFMLFEQHEA